MEGLPEATFDLDEWKRIYSKTSTADAMQWFWENLKPEEYSLWKPEYKYNDELTRVFMSANIISKFFASLEASRKYMSGCLSVYGDDYNDSIIQGAFLIRGQGAAPAFDIAPDFERYEFTKLDPTNRADKEFVNAQWGWNRPIVVNGKTYPWASGKAFHHMSRVIKSC